MREICTAAIREVVPPAWLNQLSLDLARHSTASGRFSGDLAFMRIRGQRGALYGWRPSPEAIERAQTSTTDCRGSDLGIDRFGFHSQDWHRWIWLDEPGNVVRRLR